MFYQNKGVDERGFPRIKYTTNPEQQKFLKKVFEHAYQYSPYYKRKIQVQAKIDQKNGIGRASEDLYKVCLVYVEKNMSKDAQIQKLIKDISESYSSTQNPDHHNLSLAVLFGKYVSIREPKPRHHHGPIMLTSDTIKGNRLTLDTLGSSSYLPKISSKVRFSKPIKKKTGKTRSQFLREFRRKNK